MPQAINDNTIWKNKYFPNQLNPQEDIILILREDIVILLFQVITNIIFFLVATLVRAILSRYFVTLGPSRYILDIVYHTFNIILLSRFFMRFHDYYLSFQIITDERVIDISQKGLFNREVNELQYSKIEDVTHKQNGLLATMFNFGDVVVQTAASASASTSGFIFKSIPNPSKAHKIITDLCQRENPNVQPVYIANPNQPNQYQTAQQFNPSVNIPNPLPPTYRENVLNISESLDDHQS